jgi:MFS family permease
MNAGEFVKRMWVLMLTVFVDMIGFLIVLPLLPFYAEKLGASPTMVGALVSTFALAQMVTAPLWGKLSDRFGRRPAILAGLAISAVSYVVFESAGTVWLLFVSRFVQGCGAGTVGVVQAYVSDSVPREDRAKSLGWITVATSAGVMAGPAIASLAAAKGVLGPGYLAAALCVLNFIFATIWLPESAPRKAAGAKRPPRGGTTRAMLEVINRPAGQVGSVVWIYSMGMMAFMAMNGVLALYLQRRFGVDETTIGWFYVYVGGISLVMRMLVLGPTVRRFGEVRTLRMGIIAVGLGMAAVPLARNFVELALAVPLVPIGTALLFPATTSLLSHRAPENQTGMYLGVQQMFGGVSRMAGPLWAGAAFQHFGIAVPFFMASGLMLVARLFSGVLREDDPEPQAGEVEPSVTVEPS